ncbi:NAD(P)-binding domain-containing protein [Streptomyces sp. NBC_01142]|uniref:NAD(P)-dependent oxidoreductase n=1 Tax=Streptomyces sp. NBC_01142 TaxID=2975865 RepID=UPI002258544A|nr:NAD(P)-binding domain-containing protein [Streptomyces sp. NBC_01142]MCX4818533.1 NAD(P)-binding domain-containing protein [Streptomyces sp. NBC_01142]
MPANKPANQSAVSVLGLGMMGTALAAAFLGAGHPVTVWNRSPAKTGPLIAQGALPADTAADAVAASPLVVVCLLTNDNFEELLATLTEDVAGRTLVNLTNGTPAQARELAAWAAEHGAQYIDGGIMAVPQMIAGPHAYVLYSGDEQAYETHRPTLAALGATRWTGTDPGLAALQDLALLAGMYGMFTGVLQAFALVRTENIPATEFSELLVPWISAMLSGAPELAKAIDSGQHLTDVSSLAVNQAAFPNFLTTFRDQGISGELFEPIQALLDRAVDQGHAADGLSRLADLLTVRS